MRLPDEQLEEIRTTAAATEYGKTIEVSAEHAYWMAQELQMQRRYGNHHDQQGATAMMDYPRLNDSEIDRHASNVDERPYVRAMAQELRTRRENAEFPREILTFQCGALVVTAETSEELRETLTLILGDSLGNVASMTNFLERDNLR